MTRVVLALGSNVGRRQDHLSAAVFALSKVVGGLRASSVYESPPMYLEDQPAFLNMAVLGESEVGPLKLLREIKQIEQDLGRKKRERNGPREIDIDLVLYGAAVFRSMDLVVPHPRLAERRFVVEPVAELDPDIRVPGLGRIGDLMNLPEIQRQEVKKVDGAEIRIPGI